MGRVRGEYRAKKLKGSNVRGGLVASLLIQGRHVELIPSSHSIHVFSTIAEACGYIKKRANCDLFMATEMGVKRVMRVCCRLIMLDVRHSLSRVS